MSLKKNVILIATILLLTKCASTYTSINPTLLKYPEIQTRDTSIVLQYKYNVLTDAKNDKYAKKEKKFSLNLLAIKITNNTDKPIYTDSLEYYNGNTIIATSNPNSTKKILRQKSGYYLFYLLLTPMQLRSDGESTPIGLVVGPALAFGNMGLALSANHTFKKNLTEYSVKHKTIQPKESIYALIGMRNTVGDPVYVRLK